MKKPELRDRYIERRRDMTPLQVAKKSKAVLERLKTEIDWQSARYVHVYESVDSWNEVHTSDLIRFIQTELPDIDLTVGAAIPGTPVPTLPYDIVVVPLLAFDRDWNRLGFGGGWYDRFLAALPNATKVGLAYDLQRTDSISAEPHDIALDMVVTESGVTKK